MDKNLEEYYRVFAFSLDANKLLSSYKHLFAYIRQSEENANDDAVSLLVKTLIKYAIVLYFNDEHDYSEEKYKIAADKLATARDYAKSKNFTYTVEDAQTCLAELNTVHPLMRTCPSYLNRILELINDNSSPEALLPIRKELENIHNQLCLPSTPVFTSGIKFVDPYDYARKDISALINEIDTYLAKKNSSFAKDLLAQCSESLVEKIDVVCSYVPRVDLDEKQVASTIIVHTPIIKEAFLLVDAYSRNHGLESIYLNFKNITTAKIEDIKGLFSYLKDKKDVILFIDGINALQESRRNEAIKQIAKLAKANNKVFVYDPEPHNDLYQAFISKLQGEDNFSILDITYVYLGMPNYDQTIDLLKSKKIINENTDLEKIRIKLPFMGFYGLNKIISHAMDDNPIKFGEKISERNDTEVLKRYVAGLSNVALFIDASWGVLFTRDADDSERSPLTFDYDELATYNPENIELIQSSTFNMYAKSGLLVRYILLNTDSIDHWEDFDYEEKCNRIKHAIKALAVLLGIINRKPEVEIVDFKEKNYYGLCVNGGNLIQISEKIVEKYDQVFDTLSHETFHAFQHEMIERPYPLWLMTDFGITESRVNEWSANNRVYIPPEKDINSYRYQIFESDANSFAHEALACSGKYWHLIDWR